MSPLAEVYQLLICYSYSAGAGPDGKLTNSIKNLYSGMAQTTEAVAPFALIQNLRTLAPQFAEQDQRGQFAQQGWLASMAKAPVPTQDPYTCPLTALQMPTRLGPN